MAGSKKYLLIAGVGIIGAIGLYLFFKRDQATNLFGAVKSAPKKIGSALGIDSPVLSKSEAAAYQKAAKTAASPVPAHSPPVRKATAATLPDINTIADTFSRLASRNRADAQKANVANSKGSIQPDPHLARAIAGGYKSSPSTTSRPVAKTAVAPKISPERLKQLEANQRSQREMEKEIMDLKRSRRRRGFY